VYRAYFGEGVQMRFRAALFLSFLLLLILSQFRLSEEVGLPALLMSTMGGVLFGLLFNQITMNHIRNYGFSTHYKDVSEEKKAKLGVIILVVLVVCLIAFFERGTVELIALSILISGLIVSIRMAIYHWNNNT
jgi:predicted alpha/beta hydrolase